MEETVLIQAARMGRDDALRALFESNKEKIYAVAYRYMRNKEDAEDVVQDTFIKAFNALEQFNDQSGTALISWLYRIAINTSIDLLRKKKKMKTKLSNPYLQDQAYAKTATDDPADADVIRDARERIAAVLDQLTSKQRMVFVLRHFQHFSLKEIALHMNCSTGGVKKQLFRAVSMVKNELKGLMTEEGL